MFRSTAAAMAAMLLFAHAGLAQPVAVSHPGKDAKDARSTAPRGVPAGREIARDNGEKSRVNAERSPADSKPDELKREESKRDTGKREEIKVAPRIPGSALGIGAVSPGLRAPQSGAHDRAPFAGHWQGREVRRDDHDRRSDHARRDGGPDILIGGGVSIVIGGGQARFDHRDRSRDDRGGFCGTPVCQPPVTRLLEEFHIDGRRIEAEVTLWFDRS